MTNAVKIVSVGGIVVFLPSYEYEKRLNEHFEKKGYIEKLQLKKSVFREPKRADQMDKVLKEYARNCAKGMKGAILFSVVGGKMSEGINFNDDLGRCVIMVGLPFPNKNSPELAEKMRHLDKNSGSGAGRRYYVGLCMKAVNQSIGRAIRHKADFATVLLLDERFERPEIRGQLPEWIGDSTIVAQNFGGSLGAMAKFYKSKYNI